MERKVKLFRDKDENEQYTLGRVGDYMVDSSDTINNIRIMRKDLFEEIYRDSGEQEEQKSVIFDLDGTLLYSLEDLKNATNAALESQNMPTCTLDQVRRYVGNGVRMLMVRAVPDGEKNPKFEETNGRIRFSSAIKQLNSYKIKIASMPFRASMQFIYLNYLLERSAVAHRRP